MSTEPSAVPRRVAFLVGSVVLLVVAALTGIAVGARHIPLDEVWRALTAYAGTGDHLIVRDVRIPRTVMGIAVGAALGVSGALIQVMTRNPLAEPGILGVTSGAGFAITVGGALGMGGSQPAQLVLAAVGALLVAALVYGVGRSSPLRLVLTGVALSSVLSGAALGLRLLMPDVFDEYRFWAVGSLAGREQAPVFLPLLVIAIALLGALAVSRPLGALALGEQVAQTLGGHVVRTRVVVLLLVTALAGAATAVAGPIAFAGLIVPHLARRAARGSVAWLVVLTMLLGAVLLVAADVAARVLLPTGEVPVAVVTAFLGGPALIWAVRRQDLVT
ncbi:iron chelate uptake ABC transporter family permease subunit [Spongiactinospora sp. TRM90649]|uniref:FecCD family ABC transporter permease n=1 Tax=Spongiactinospora sp. TRM90649 TaxID=3031114 RepID=UPI0023F935B8|nr:iron chelate uptake ABC transporter family permease subunit [Spongiactinospora sp. TRM90649]MDF5758365.1 iron chelate uptake ABC transporter family permease subunit [Spongiactinospora sp. TRM90649]